MATEIIPQDLLIHRTILTTALAKITNEMYANNIKISYRYDFELVPLKNKPSMFINLNKSLYLFRVYAVDKSRNPIGETHYLYNNYYPKDFTNTIYQIERAAIQDWFTNASKALYNHTYEQYVAEQKAKQAIADSRLAQGITEENTKQQIAVNDGQLIANREAEILNMMNPNIIK